MFWTKHKKSQESSSPSEYQIMGELNAGGMGQVFLGVKHGLLNTRQMVVLKVPNAKKNHAKGRSEFKDEARVTAHLNHPNIIRALDWTELNGHPCIVTEYVHGFDLRLILRYFNSNAKHLPLYITAQIMMQTLEAVQYIHNATTIDGDPLNIVHRDIDPTNILISDDGFIKIIDFGIAKNDMQEEMTRPGVYKGKFVYVAPDVFLPEAVDQRADIFSLGVVLYELLTGQRPRYFNKNNSLSDIIQHITTTEIPAPSSVIPELPKMFDHIVAKATAMDRNQRYATVAEMLNDIRRLSKKLISGADHTYMKRWMHKELRSLRKRRAQQFEAMKKNAPQLPVSTANDKPKSSPRQSASANVSSADDTFRETPLPVAEDCHHLNIAGVLHRLKTSPLPLATSLIGAHILFLLIVFQMRQPPVSRDFAPTPPSPTPVIIQTPPRQTVACNHDMRQPAPSFAEVNIPHLQIQSEALGATLPYRPIATNSTSANNSNIKRWNAQWKKRKSQSKPR